MQGFRDRGATPRLGGAGGAPLVTQYWGDTRHFFLLNLSNLKNIGGGGGRFPPPPSPAARSLDLTLKKLLCDANPNF